jgi:hypothetical protein
VVEGLLYGWRVEVHKTAVELRPQNVLLACEVVSIEPQGVSQECCVFVARKVVEVSEELQDVCGVEFGLEPVVVEEEVEEPRRFVGFLEGPAGRSTRLP